MKPGTISRSVAFCLILPNNVRFLNKHNGFQSILGLLKGQNGITYGFEQFRKMLD